MPVSPVTRHRIGRGDAGRILAVARQLGDIVDSSFPIVVVFRGMAPSVAVHSLIERHAHRMQEGVPGLEMLGLQAMVERREWPSRPPTVQVTLELGLPEATLTATAGDFGRSNAFMAMDAAFNELRSRIARLPIARPLPPAALAAGART